MEEGEETEVTFKISVIGGPFDGNTISFNDDPPVFELYFYDDKDHTIRHDYKRTGPHSFEYQGQTVTASPSVEETDPNPESR